MMWRIRARDLMLCVGVALGCVGVAAGSSPGLELRFERLNGVYEDLEAFVEPIQSGPLTIQLASPSHRLEMRAHEILLSPLGDGRHRFRGSVRFLGEGTLHAEMDFGGIPATFGDRVVFPDQTREIDATVFIEPVEEGYLVTADELPPFVEVEVESQLASQLVAWCGRIALFVAGDAGCATLDRQLRYPRLPLPAPGTTYLVRADDLTPDERSLINLYLLEFPDPGRSSSPDPR